MLDRKLFSELLVKAMGDRSMNDYKKECGVSVAHISRLIGQKRNSAPSPETIKKFAKFAHNGVTYEELMIAAGHITQSEIDSNKKYVYDNKIYDLEELIKNGKAVVSGKILDLEESDLLLNTIKYAIRTRRDIRQAELSSKNKKNPNHS